MSKLVILPGGTRYSLATESGSVQALPKKHLPIHFQKMENLRDNNRLSAAGTILVLN